MDATFLDAPKRRNLKKADYEALKEHDENGTQLPFGLDKEEVYSVRNFAYNILRYETLVRLGKAKNMLA